MWYRISIVSPSIVIWHAHSSANSVFLGTVYNNELSKFLTAVTWSDRWEKKKDS